MGDLDSKMPLRWMLGLLVTAAISGSLMQLWASWQVALKTMERQVLSAQAMLEVHTRDAVRHQESLLRVLGESFLVRHEHIEDAQRLVAREGRIQGFALLGTDGSKLVETVGWYRGWDEEAGRLVMEASAQGGRLVIGKPQQGAGGETVLPIAIAVSDAVTGTRAIAVAGWDVENLLGRLEFDSIDSQADFWLVIKSDGQHYLLTEGQVQQIMEPQLISRWVAEIEMVADDPTVQKRVGRERGPDATHESHEGLHDMGHELGHVGAHGNIQAVWAKVWPGKQSSASRAVGAVCQVEPWAISIGASLPLAVAREKLWQDSRIALGWGLFMLLASGAAYRIMSRSHSAYERRLIDQASRDPLTGLGNRAFARDHLGLELARAERSGKLVAVMMIDLDNFKELNDARGHEAGDRLLTVVAQSLGKAARNTDIISRQGGDEFLLVCGDLAGEAEVQAVAERFMETLRQAIKGEVDGLRISASVGVAVTPRDGKNPDDLLRKADRAMYEAKAHGKDNLRFYDEDLNKKAQRRLDVERCLDGALDRNEIWLVLQPQWHARTGECIGFEALARWRCGELGDVPPSEFVPIAEESRRICGIGAFVLRESIAACLRLSEAAGYPIRASVNLSAKQFREERLESHVEGLLAEYGVDGRRLVLEVTESAMMRDIDDAIAKLGKLRALDVGVSVDDFGTGYSSLSYLHRLPTTEIKIDRSFVQDMEDNPGALELTTAIAGLGRSLGLEVVAEGVETDGQAKLLRGMGVDILQGYLLGKPMPLEELEAILRARCGSGATS